MCPGSAETLIEYRVGLGYVIPADLKSTDIKGDVLECLENFRRLASERNIKLKIRGMQLVALAGHQVQGNFLALKKTETS